jgi:type II secretory pathway pseudopilin PulG
MDNYLKANKGISIIEIMVVISIIVLIIAIVIPGFTDFRNQQAIAVTTEDVASLLNEARNNTISSINSNTYGVHFESTRAVLFTGSSFSESSNNKQIDFSHAINIPTTGGINLNGGGSNVVFQRITGDTANSGTIVIRLQNDTTKQKIININSIGVISVN